MTFFVCWRLLLFWTQGRICSVCHFDLNIREVRRVKVMLFLLVKKGVLGLIHLIFANLNVKGLDVARAAYIWSVPAFLCLNATSLLFFIVVSTDVLLAATLNRDVPDIFETHTAIKIDLAQLCWHVIVAGLT